MRSKLRIFQTLFSFGIAVCALASFAFASDLSLYNDSGIPANTGINTWSNTATPPAAIFDGSYTGIVPEEGVKCFRTSHHDWAGWDIHFTNGLNDLSSYSGYNLTFWVKSNTNLKIEMKDNAGVSDPKNISDYGWDNTVTWQKISIPVSAFTRNLSPMNISQMYSPFMVTMYQAPYGDFFIDDVKIEGVGNHAPIIDSVAVKRTIATQPYNYNVHATDYDGNTLTFSLSQSPANMSINAQTGVIQWTPALSDVGIWPVIVKVDDGHGGVALQDYSIQVVAPNTSLYQTAFPYIKYFLDNALPASTGFGGLTRSFQFDLGGNDAGSEAFISSGAASYDQSILGRITLDNGETTILTTYMQQHSTITNNPLMKLDAGFNDASGDPIYNGPYRIVRILNRDVPNWNVNWDWTTDTGAAACLIIYAAEAYQQTRGADDFNLAVLWGDYLLRLQDTDGGLRYGPVGLYNPNGLDYYWKLKSTEQNERSLYAFQALYQITGRQEYDQAASNIQNWLKQMYEPSVHLFHSSATFNGTQWVKAPLGTASDYVATDVTAFAPTEIMFADAFFGSTQAQRDAEVDAMFAAIEGRTAFLDGQSQPLFYRFSISQDMNTYGSVEISSQMALAYLRVSQIYQNRGISAKAQQYLNKYNSLILSLENFFTAAPSDPNAKIAPYASYYSTKTAAGLVFPYGAGNGSQTYNCRAALASAYFAFAKAGFDPLKITPLANTNYVFNPPDFTWYGVSNTYNSTGAATAQMIINYIRAGAGQPLVMDQNAIYQYAPGIPGSDLMPEDMAKVLGHYDPYDALVTSWADIYDNLPGGNPYQGYNFSVEAFNTAVDPDAANGYLRDICHWMAFPVTQADWWSDGALVARPNTPAAVPLFGNFSHWAVVKGYASSANPAPNPHTDPFNVPNFTVYGFWVKDPVTPGIGKESYKTANEVLTTYFLPVSAGSYSGQYVQVAEPPSKKSHAKIHVPEPEEDLGNLDFIEVQSTDIPSVAGAQVQSLSAAKDPMVKRPRVRKHDWQDLLPRQLLSDPDCKAAFDTTKKGKPFYVKRMDVKNSGYYLVPFNKQGTKAGALTSAVILLDAGTGYFKEASWTKTPEKFLKVDEQTAIRLITNSILQDLSGKIEGLPKTPQKEYLKKASDLKNNYNKLISYLDRAKADLLWQPRSPYSSSPYQPFWQINVYGYIWYVTQDFRVIPQTPLSNILAGIEANRSILEKNHIYN